MAKPPGQHDEPGRPISPKRSPTPRSRWRVQLVWLVPLVAVLIGGWLAVQAILEKGPDHHHQLSTGEGLEAGKTKIKFKDVDIGVVKSVVLSPDHKRVIATAELSQGRVEHAASTTPASGSCARAFPAAPCRVSARCCPARSSAWTSARRRRRGATSSGLEAPPVFASGVPGREFVLKSDRHGLARRRLARSISGACRSAR